jgi:endo-1,4-beta-xylanase
VVVLLLVALAACTGDGGTGDAATTAATVPPTTPTTAEGDACRAAPDSCTLAQASVVSDVRMGVALGTAQLDRPEVVSLVAAEFDQVTPENEFKWRELEPAPGQFRFDRTDRLLSFAEQAGLELRGHTLIWGQQAGNGIPDWVRNIGSSEKMRVEFERYITAVVGRYKGRIARWDVVNEPLDNPGTALDDNLFTQLLGPEYIDLAFRLAAQADPDAELWLNEVDAELRPERGDALVALVGELKARGVPVDGVGLQAHLTTGAAPPKGQITDLVRRLRALGVKVAITELDIPLVTDQEDPLGRQAAAFAQVAEECVRAGCEEITVWGVSDADTWLDRQLGRRTQPLLFDDGLGRKPAYDAVREVLARG